MPPKSRVWEFQCEHLNGAKGFEWVWELEYVDDGSGIKPCKSDGGWTAAE